MTAIRANESSGHLSVHVDGQHPAPVPFLFERSRKRVAPAAVVSALWHVACGVIVVLLVRSSATTGATAASLRDRLDDGIVWLGGDGGGGGGGGNHMSQPPRQSEMPGRDRVTVPVAKPPSLETSALREPDPIQPLIIPAKLTSAGLEQLIGGLEMPPAPTLSQGPGGGGGAGPGIGPGIGSGRGPGLFDGDGGNTGGDAYRPGGPGITLPRVLREVKPQYTADAMRAKVQGTVVLACVVLADGTVGDVHVIRSLDPTFGLDQQAIAAAKQWRFAPGTRTGRPVPVQITIELTFTIR